MDAADDSKVRKVKSKNTLNRLKLHNQMYQKIHLNLIGTNSGVHHQRMWLNKLDITFDVQPFWKSIVKLTAYDEV